MSEFPLFDRPDRPRRTEGQVRLVRVLRVAALLNRAPGHWTRAMLASHLGCSTRGIDRDLEVLRSIGYTIHKRHGGGYAIESSGGLPEPPEPPAPPAAT